MSTVKSFKLTHYRNFGLVGRVATCLQEAHGLAPLAPQGTTFAPVATAWLVAPPRTGRGRVGQE
jgi:hypothetical protein